MGRYECQEVAGSSGRALDWTTTKSPHMMQNSMHPHTTATTRSVSWRMIAKIHGTKKPMNQEARLVTSTSNMSTMVQRFGENIIRTEKVQVTIRDCKQISALA